MSVVLSDAIWYYHFSELDCKICFRFLLICSGGSSVLLEFRALNTLGDFGNLTSLLRDQQGARLEKRRQELIKTKDVMMCRLVKDTARHYEEMTK